MHISSCFDAPKYYSGTNENDVKINDKSADASVQIALINAMTQMTIAKENRKAIEDSNEKATIQNLNNNLFSFLIDGNPFGGKSSGGGGGILSLLGGLF